MNLKPNVIISLLEYISFGNGICVIAIVVAIFFRFHAAPYEMLLEES